MRAGFRRPATALLLSTALATTPVLAQGQAATVEQAQPAPDTSGYGEIIVTAQKRSENIQHVPISITAIGEQKLKDLNLTDFKQYVQQLPSVTFQPSANTGGNPGQSVIYMRGIAAGGEGNHSGPLPAVGVYLDEQPVTTVGGNLDVHIYDIARIEALAGPQGTLYGASSEAGTVRIITNQPKLGVFEGSVDGEINTVAHGDVGGQINGMVNVPLNEHMALRVVGWYQHDAGYIDNVPGCRSFLPEESATSCISQNGGIVVDNAKFVKNNYNDTEIYGGRAALKIDLDGNWTVTPQIMGQETLSHGSYGYDPLVGDLEVQHFLPEYREDHFIQAALTIEGKLGNWDVTYAGAYLDRRDHQSSDYTDYAEAYDHVLYHDVGGIAGYFYFHDAAGNAIPALQQVVNTDHFKKLSQELRVASPTGDRLRLVAGAFFQRQSNEIHQDYEVANLAADVSVNGMPGTLWLTQQYRVDRDYAMFGEASWDIVPTVTITGGVRGYMYDNSLVGFFGFGRDPADGYTALPHNAAGSSQTGVAQCFTDQGLRLNDAIAAGASTTLLPAYIPGAPCTNLATYANGRGLQPVDASGDGVTYRGNVSWKPNSDTLLYATVSRGFRPGGINRRVDVGPYGADFLTNYEAGWKLTFLGGMLRFNGAFYEEDWKNFQYAYLGANSFTEIHNGPNARVRGVETQVTLNAGPLNLDFSGAYNDAKIRENLCLNADPTFVCSPADGNMVTAPKGTRLPITPEWKLAGTARYTVPVGTAKVYGQINATYQSSAASDIRTAFPQTGTGDIINPAALTGRLPEYATVNLALGSTFDKFRIEGYISNLLDARGQLSRFIECGQCFQRVYVVPITPRTIGLRVGADF
jgi:outer membrane receptor protein involved in Fe transport